MEPWPPHCTEPAIRRAFAQIRWEAQREKSYVPPILFIRFFWQKKTWRSKCENSVLQMFHYAACIANFKCYHTDSLIVRNSRTIFFVFSFKYFAWPGLMLTRWSSWSPHPSPFTLHPQPHPSPCILDLHPHPGCSSCILHFHPVFSPSPWRLTDH